ncbi:MAG: family glycosyltransferase, 4-amino-4-deoxy-L-arabinose transferase [Schlesneria sp.]|nr:family glycosyltransferase, 4-amino-4-deoxy-L-arabinose transferase [Schlesneria sp.]
MIRYLRRWIDKLNSDSSFAWTVLLIHACLLWRLALINTPVFDEIAHLPAGLIHWKSGCFDAYRVNPPLMRMIATCPLLFMNAKLSRQTVSSDPYSRDEFLLGRLFLQENENDYFDYFAICRCALIPISLLGGWMCRNWARELYGEASGRIALLLWCFCPNILAWGSLITPDLGAAAFGVTAGYAFWRWLKAPTWKHTFVAGFCMGLAELSKSTWIILFVLWPVIWLCWYWQMRTAFRKSAVQCAAISLIALYVLNSGYAWEGSFCRLGDFRFVSTTLGGMEAHAVPGNRFRESLLASLPLPVPANYVKGIDVQRYDFERGKWSYLRGEQRFGGWYYYYLYALTVKLPLGTLLLTAISAFTLVCVSRYRQDVRHDFILLAPAIAIIIVVSSQTGFNRYLRYVLPAAPFIYIFASRVGMECARSSLLLRRTSEAAVFCVIVASVSTYPHSLSYFNLLAGGPAGGPAHLLDANIDWGQDLFELKRIVEQHPEMGTIRLAYFGIIEPRLAHFPHEILKPIHEEDGDATRLAIAPGWYAISVNHVHGYRYRDGDIPIYTHFKALTPKYMAGYSIYIYHITESYALYAPDRSSG